MSITYGAGGTTKVNTVEIGKKIIEFNLPALAHLTCVGNTKETINETIKQMKTTGIKNVLALRGDYPQDLNKEQATEKGLEHASDLVPILKQAGFCVGSACYPECHPESANRIDDIKNLKYKVEAGVDFLTTQMFFYNNMLYSYLYRLQSKGIHLPVLAGIMPITNSSQIARIVKLSSAYIPEKLLAICGRFENNPQVMRQAGIACVTYLESLHVDVLGFNCGGNLNEDEKLAELFCSYAHTPIIAQPNACLPDVINGKDVFKVEPEEFSESQINAGAHILDVNTGLPGIDEKEMITTAVKTIQATFNIPLQLDSSEDKVLEYTLRYYNGKALVNSINGKQGIQFVLGVSNISFGLPRRDIINSRFFELALDAGLSAAASAPMMDSYRAYRSLAGYDENSLEFIETYTGTLDPTTAKAK